MTLYRKNQLPTFWWMLVLGLAMLPNEGRTQAPQREADKAEGIKRIFTKQKFEMGPVVRKQNKAFCGSFLRDFGQQKDIEFVEPDVRSESYDDPVWQRYRGRCTNLASEFFDTYHCEPRNAEFIEQLPKDQRDDEYRSSCKHYRGTSNFKHYLVDINNDPKDGKEHVFFFERARGPLNRPGAQRYYASGMYSVIDLDRCELRGGAEAHDPYEDSQPSRLLQNYSGIIRYKEKHYIFDLYELIGIATDPKNPNFILLLNGYAKFGREVRSRLGPLCAYNSLITKGN